MLYNTPNVPSADQADMKQTSETIEVRCLPTVDQRSSDRRQNRSARRLGSILRPLSLKAADGNPPVWAGDGYTGSQGESIRAYYNYTTLCDKSRQPMRAACRT